MAETSKISILILLILVASCDSNLKVETTGALTDCNTFAEGSNEKAECIAKKGLPEETVSSLNLSIVTKSFITNKNEFYLKWEEDPIAQGYHLSLTSDPGCQEELLGFAQFETDKTMGVVNDGLFHICVYSMLADGSEKPFDNNGIPFTIDRRRPKVNEDKKTLPEILTGPTDIAIPAQDLTDLTYEWSQTLGPGNLQFSPTNSSNTTLTYDIPGTYSANVVITDAAGNITNITYAFEARPPKTEMLFCTWG